jgi:hypothetical protein
MSLPRKPANRSGRTILSVLVFLALFCVLLALVVKFYIVPEMEEAKHLSRSVPAEFRRRKEIAAHAMLVLMLMLTLLVLGLLMTFRFGRLFFPLPTPLRTKTKVIDAWAEAGKRLEQRKSEEPEERPDEQES